MNDSITLKYDNSINEYILSDKKNLGHAYFIGNGTTKGLLTSKTGNVYLSTKFDMTTLKELILLENKFRKVILSVDSQATFQWVENRQLTFFNTDPKIVDLEGKEIEEIQPNSKITFKMCLESIKHKQDNKTKKKTSEYSVNCTLVVVKVLSEAKMEDLYDCSI